MLMETARSDARSVTGNNHKNIMLLLGKSDVQAVKKEEVKNIEYFPIKEAESWRIDAIKEVIEVKTRTLDIDNFKLEELEEILTYLCTS